MTRPTETVCTAANLVDAAKCYKNLDAVERKALMVYLKALELDALGGTDYTAQLGPGGTLNTAAAAYKTMSADDVTLAHLVIEADNADSSGATVSTDIQTLADAIKCLKNFDAPTLERMDLLLTCLLGRHAAYPQVDL